MHGRRVQVDALNRFERTAGHHAMQSGKDGPLLCPMFEKPRLLLPLSMSSAPITSAARVSSGFQARGVESCILVDFCILTVYVGGAGGFLTEFM